jgi:hypothetical protein
MEILENDAENDEEIAKLLDGLDGDPKKVEVGAGAGHQGLTLVRFSAQRKRFRFLWDRGCA